MTPFLLQCFCHCCDIERRIHRVRINANTIFSFGMIQSALSGKSGSFFVLHYNKSHLVFSIILSVLSVEWLLMTMISMGKWQLFSHIDHRQEKILFSSLWAMTTTETKGLGCCNSLILFFDSVGEWGEATHCMAFHMRINNRYTISWLSIFLIILQTALSIET